MGYVILLFWIIVYSVLIYFMTRKKRKDGKDGGND